MSIRENVYQVIDLIKPEHVLVSVFDKNGLEGLVRGILEVNPSAKFYSTGGTGKKIIEILGPQSGKNYVSVEEFTGAPEMEGGLVKTLHPKIHAGLLAERGNPTPRRVSVQNAFRPRRCSRGLFRHLCGEPLSVYLCDLEGGHDVRDRTGQYRHRRPCDDHGIGQELAQHRGIDVSGPV